MPTGQHYDAAMSDSFFNDLELPQPNENLGVGSGTHAEQTARIMLGFEPVLDRYRPDWVIVYGDVNSTVAALWSPRRRAFGSLMSKPASGAATGRCPRK